MNTVPDTTGEGLGFFVAPALAARLGVVVHLGAVEFGLLKSAVFIGHSDSGIGAAAANRDGGNGDRATETETGHGAKGQRKEGEVHGGRLYHARATGATG